MSNLGIGAMLGILVGNKEGERESVKDWAFCPECGCRESWTISRGGERECKKCKRTWFPDIDYSDAVSDNLTVANTHREFVLAVENVMEHELNIGVPTKEACVDAIRTLAQTAKDATARADAAEKERAELKMRNNNLHEENINVHKLATDLRAQLDAMTGEQKPWAYDVKGWGIFRCKDEQTLEKELQHAAKMTYRTDFQPIPLYRHPAPPHDPFAAFIDALKADRDMQWYYHCNVAMAACDKGVPHDQANAAAFLFMERLLGEYTPLHTIPEYTPAPALPVVGTMKVTKRADGGRTILGVWDENFAQSVPEAGSYNILLGAPLPTEGGK